MDFTLRPMSTSEVLDRMFYLYRKNFALFAGIATLPAIVGLIINLLQVSSGVVSPRLALLAIPMFIAALVLLVHLYARVSFSTSACVLENAGAMQSIQRSLTLTKGRSGRVWLVLLLTIVLNWVLAIAIVFPITIATAATNSLMLTQ